VARHADGLLFNSQFSRDRFNTRFPVYPEIAAEVTHHSFLAEEYVDPAAERTPVSDYILIFGNELDHKHLRPTLDVLADGFPFTAIVVFGLEQAATSRVTAIPSGHLARSELHRLIAGARVMVYPSFYEGFGLPVVEGLAYGRPVIVRRSPLWTEIANSSRLPGDLIEFDDAPSLIEAVGRVFAGCANSSPRKGALRGANASPMGWKDCAARLLALLDRCSLTADGRRWVEREETLQLAGF
jgi:glycosyltransferase involved in cell wall biosynthesis